MYSIINLNHKNFELFKRMNAYNNIFNRLNENFIESYEAANIILKLVMRRNVKLLKNENEYIGYIWTTPSYKDSLKINSINVIDEKNRNRAEPYKMLIESTKASKQIYYNCEVNEINRLILETLNFTPIDGTVEMMIDLSNIDVHSIYRKDIDAVLFKKNQHEETRCFIQNETFRSGDRMPLTITDIYADEKQEYYLENGGMFIKKDDVYIGYGQIILEDNKISLVNIGILTDYRNNGYGEFLIRNLLKAVKERGFNSAFIKVNYNNVSALRLYNKLGFFKIKENLRYKKR